MKHNLYFENYFNSFEPLFLEIGHKKIIKKGDIISSYDDELYIYYVKDGTLLLSLDNIEGDRKAFMYHGIGTLTPYSLARPQNGIFKIDLDIFITTAMTDIDAVAIRPDAFHDAFTRNPDLATAFLHYVIDHSNLYLTEQLHLSYSSPFNKTASFVMIYTQYLMDHGVYLTQNEIGEFIGETRLEVARSLKKLRDLKILETSRTRIKVFDYEKLEKASDPQFTADDL